MLIVIKIGSNILTTSDNKLDLNSLRELCNQLAKLRQQGLQIAIVTSGAIVSGSERLRLQANTIPEKQAAAAVGQSLLVNEYNNFLEPHGIPVAQILLTKNGLEEKERRIHAHDTLKTLFNLGAIPIINENDTVVVDEIRFGDNDILSAYVAEMLNADKLIILTDIAGLYTANPREDKNAKLVSQVDEVTEKLLSSANTHGSGKGTGGMLAKLKAARYACLNGIETVVANGREEQVLTKLLLDDKALGTKFSAAQKLG
jgi:glutamate 5-kinase